MDLRDRKVKVFSAELLRDAGLDESLQAAFSNAERFKKSVDGHTTEVLERLINITRNRLESRTMTVFGVDAPVTVTNLYSPWPEVQMPDVGKQVESFEGVLGFIVQHNALGMEVTHQVRLKDSGIAVDYDGMIRRNNSGLAYVENERS